MKILYISPENTVGTLSLWKKTHEARGNQCEFVTLFEAQNDFDSGLCLNLPFVTAKPWYMTGRHKYYQLYRGKLGDYKEKYGFPPVWNPHSKLEKWYFSFRDWLWHFKIEPTIEQHQLLEFDIIHLEWGLEFYRDCNFVKRLVDLNKGIACTYHGQDLRTRGVLPAIDKVSKLNMTSEIDLLDKHPNMKYMFLPFDTDQFLPNVTLNNPIRVCHSPTNRYYKGSETIIPICEQLEEEQKIEFILLENKPFKEVQSIKQTCDILIDQVHNRGGWGYGMNSVEALAMGLCCVTELVPKYVEFIPDHPFINVTGDTLYEALVDLISNNEKIIEHKRNGRSWALKHHGLRHTADTLYSYYNELGWL